MTGQVQRELARAGYTWRMSSRIIGAIVLLLLCSCRTWTLPGELDWKVIAPAKVIHAAKNELVFHVETRTKNGEPVEGVGFVWIIEWVGTHGWDHKGTSFSEQSIRAKGRPGTAYIRIFTYDANGT